MSDSLPVDWSSFQSTSADRPRATAIGGRLMVHAFNDGALGIIDLDTRQAMHLSPDKAARLRAWVKVFDEAKALEVQG
jgi:hypothetical protein